MQYVCVAGMALPLLACAGSGASAPAASGDGAVLKAPLKIPMPLDKAGFKVDVTFDVPPPPKVSHSTGYFLGIRMLFAPSDPDKKIATIDAHPVEVRVTLHRLQDGKEIPVKFWNSVAIIKGYEPIRYENVSLKDDVALSRGIYSDHSGAPPGTPDASTYVLRFGGPEEEGPGRYRLRLETLKDIPELQGFKAFMAFERAPDR